MPVLQIEQLGDQRRRAQVHSYAQPFLRREREEGIVGENGGVPLAQLEDQVSLDSALAGQTPAVLDLSPGKPLLLRLVERRMALVDPDATTPALPLAAAGKLDSVLEQDVPQQRAFRRAHDLADRLQRDS